MSDAPAPSRQVVRFGAFELDLRVGELRKAGLRVNLQEQPFKVLECLVERPGELVSREELRQRLWRGDTFVGSYQKVAPSPIISEPNTWKTENEEVIQQLLAQGNTRDESGEPLTAAGGPSMKKTASPIPAPSGVR